MFNYEEILNECEHFNYEVFASQLEDEAALEYEEWLRDHEDER